MRPERWHPAPEHPQNPAPLDLDTVMPPRIPRYAVILTHNRPDMLQDTVNDIAPQCDVLVIVDNASDPPVPYGYGPPHTMVMRVPDQPPNLARLWNRALDAIAVQTRNEHDARWDVALLCDDLAIPPHWYDRVSKALRENNASAASAHKHYPTNQVIIKYQPDQDVMNRMAGEAFILPGEKGMRADPSMQWWYLDDDIDFQARAADGMVIAPGDPAVNRQPNYWTVTKPNLSEQAGRDAEAFKIKWGRPRW